MRSFLVSAGLVLALAASLPACSGGGGSSSLSYIPPTTAPTSQPTVVPSTSPTTQPTASPTTQPTAVPSASPSATPTDIVSVMAASGHAYFFTNKGNDVNRRSTSPTSVGVTGGGTASQTKNSDGSVTLAISDVPELGQAWSGVYFPIGTIGTIGKGFTVQGAGDYYFGSLIYDVNKDGQYLGWTGDANTGNGGDIEAVITSVSQNGTLAVDANTEVSVQGKTYTVGQLAGGAISGINATTQVALRLYVAGSGTLSVTIKTFEKH